jgi:hypothetical protein
MSAEKVITVRLPEDLHRRVMERARRSGLSANTLAIQGIRLRLDLDDADPKLANLERREEAARLRARLAQLEEDDTS